MGREQLRFYVSAIGAGVAGSVLGTLLGWGDEGLFAAGVVPLWAVLFIFIRRDRALRSDLPRAIGRIG